MVGIGLDAEPILAQMISAAKTTPIAATPVPLTSSTPPMVAEVGSKIIVRNWAELDTALGAANAGSTIHMRTGEYVATHALVIPEGVALEGGGQMLTNKDGLPICFSLKTLTTLRATAAVQGDFITMLDGSTMRNIQIIDTEQARPLYNVVAIVSQHPFDSIEADIIACEIRNCTASPASGRMALPGAPC